MKQNTKWMPSEWKLINLSRKLINLWRQQGCTNLEKKISDFSYIFCRFILLIVDRHDDIRSTLNKSIDRFTILDNITVIDETTKNFTDFFFVKEGNRFS